MIMPYGTKKQKIGLAVCYALYFAGFVYAIIKTIILGTIDIAVLIGLLVCLLIMIVPMLLMRIPNMFTMFLAVMVVFIKFLLLAAYLFPVIIMQVVYMGGYVFLVYETYVEFAVLLLAFVTMILEIMIMKNVKMK